ncbi:hypothetical protein G7046_g6097 [Stylonectria norvegica]|nr:hypothetical protein G7046_g6097 [Stylonectria norvegica]
MAREVQGPRRIDLTSNKSTHRGGLPHVTASGFGQGTSTRLERVSGEHGNAPGPAQSAVGGGLDSPPSRDGPDDSAMGPAWWGRPIPRHPEKAGNASESGWKRVTSVRELRWNLPFAVAVSLHAVSTLHNVVSQQDESDRAEAKLGWVPDCGDAGVNTRSDCGVIPRLH